MMELRKIMKTLSFCGLVFLGFLLLFENRVVLPAWLQLLGRTHTILLHFPIALLCMVLLAVIWNEPLIQTAKWKNFEALTVLTTVVTAILGLLLSREQTDAGNTLFWHKWLGTFLAFLAYLFCFYREQWLLSQIQLRVASVILFLLLTCTGHWGGSITHGEAYLTGLFQETEPKPLVLSEAKIFKDVVSPILIDKCGNCHKGAVKKGGLSLEDSSAIFKGGKNGKSLVAGELDKSLLYQRVLLPLTDKKHMPLAEKPQLRPDELALIKHWIKIGAPFEQLLIARPLTDSFRLLSMSYLKNRLSKSTTRTYDFDAADLDQVAALSNNSRIVKPMGQGSPALAVSFFGRANYSFEQLKALKPIAEQIIHLNLAKMPINNEQLAWISGLENLEELNLNFTNIDNQALEKLSPLKKLHSISLVGTQTGFSGIEQLAKMPSLHKIYVWNTLLTSAEIKRLQEKYPAIDLEAGFQVADTMIITLNQPIIQTAAGFFKNKLSISVKHVIKDVSLHYTLDGREPDSSSSLYQHPFTVDSSCKITVKAYKNGWLPSKAVSSQFFKEGIPIVNAKLLTPPDPKYALNADKILIDHDAGDPGDFGTRALGYQKNDAIVVLDLGVITPVHQLSVLNLQNVGAYIFPPVQMILWGSDDAKSWIPLKQMNAVMPNKLVPANTPLLHISFKSVKCRYLKFSAKPIPKLPEWHPGKGQPGWFFMSELVVN